MISVITVHSYCEGKVPFDKVAIASHDCPINRIAAVFEFRQRNREHI
jgi:hypothetical protein